MAPSELPPIKNWQTVRADEAKILGPYFRRGLKLFGPVYVYAVICSLQEAMGETLGESTGNAALVLETAGVIDRARATLEQLEKQEWLAEET
jgi:hypothetical protein